jgi:hypothetical protein
MTASVKRDIALINLSLWSYGEFNLSVDACFAQGRYHGV